jgi:hypothetical protein
MSDPKQSMFPMTIEGAKFGKGIPNTQYGLSALIKDHRQKEGPTMVSVRPCAEKYGNKTFFGYLIGDVALSFSFEKDPEDNKLAIEFSRYNPAIYVPELGEVIYGAGSWWGVINSEEDLKKITNNDISNVWYVKALQHMRAAEEAKN